MKSNKSPSPSPALPISFVLLVLAHLGAGCSRDNPLADPIGKQPVCQTQSCANGETSYRFCTSDNGSVCEFIGSDGITYTCDSCSNCATASASIDGWCAQQVGGTESTTAGGTTSMQTTSGGTTSVATTSATATGTTGRNGHTGSTSTTTSTGTSGTTTAGSTTSVNGTTGFITSTTGLFTTGTTGTTTSGTTTAGTTTAGTTGASDACGSCYNSAQASGGTCYSQLNNCNNDATCSDLVDCTNNCTTQACVDTCYDNDGCSGTSPPTACSTYQALTDCLCTACSASCGSC